VAYATAPPGDAKLKAATLNFNLTGRVPLARIEDPHPAKMTAKLIAQLAAKNSYPRGFSAVMAWTLFARYPDLDFTEGATKATSIIQRVYKGEGVALKSKYWSGFRMASRGRLGMNQPRMVGF